jgi:hypothetical protein
VENPNIPSNSKYEVAVPEIIKKCPAIANMADQFQAFDDKAEVMILLGRDAEGLMHTELVNEKPLVFQTKLGLCIVGKIFKGPGNRNSLRSTLKTAMVNQDEDEIIQRKQTMKSGWKALPDIPEVVPEDSVYQQRDDDEDPGLSVEDKTFLKTMKEGIHVNKSGHLELPLPFKQGKDPILPNNEFPVKRRMKTTLGNLKKDSGKLEQSIKIMKKYIDNKHVEQIQEKDLKTKEGKVWYIPVFGVSHPRKNLRIVFDSAATYQGQSLNSNLLQGPDMLNNLRGIIMRFRENPIGIMADIEGFFHQLHVDEDHRDYMRFFWFKDNDPEKELAEYRANVHIFGNTSSPAVASFSLRSCADSAGPEVSEEAKVYMQDDFYVDDGCTSTTTAEQGTEILDGARATLGKFKFRLIKIVSNSKEVMEHYPESERAASLVSITKDLLPEQRTLGVGWDLNQDAFVISVELQEKPWTRRGVLSTINSIYDPTGLVAPVVLGGRLIQREVIQKQNEDDDKDSAKYWDQILPDAQRGRWNLWRETLEALNQISIPRCFTPKDFGDTVERTLHVFSDASEVAIGSISYVRSKNEEGRIHVAFLIGSSKVAPRTATTIPRMELNAALEAALVVRTTVNDLRRKPDQVFFYCDSQVVLGYLANKERRFMKYVARRVSMINNITQNASWRFIETEKNPADIATRPMRPEELVRSNWLEGPGFLWRDNVELPETKNIDPEELPELEQVSKKETALLTILPSPRVFEGLMERKNQWTKIVGTVEKILIGTRNALDRARTRLKIPYQPRSNANLRKEAERLLIREAQKAVYGKEIAILQKDGGFLPDSHHLSKLAVVIDKHDILRVGGRLKNANIEFGQKHPILVPKSHRISETILQHYHARSEHQGRHITHGAIISAGYHVEDARQKIRTMLAECGLCRRLRRPTEEQRMADLPTDRMEQVAAFTFCGLDVFGHWFVSEGRTTRRSTGSKKLWCLLITCLSSRAIHIEPLVDMTTNAFKNAFRRFVSIRGMPKTVRSDRGSNFTGQFGPEGEDIDLKTLQEELAVKDCEWVFNTPKSSHMGGVWERKIQAVRKILDATLFLAGSRLLTRDEMNTFLCEAACIVNKTPLTEVSDDPNDPTPITPFKLMTLKDEDDHATSINDFSENDLLAYGKNRYKRVQFLANQFWRRWREEYLQHLQIRRKWIRPKQSIAPGDAVLLREKATRRNRWPLARVESVKLSEDGLVRAATVKVAITSGKEIRFRTYERPICEMVLLAAGAVNKEAEEKKQ